MTYPPVLHFPLLHRQWVHYLPRWSPLTAHLPLRRCSLHRKWVSNLSFAILAYCWPLYLHCFPILFAVPVCKFLSCPLWSLLYTFYPISGSVSFTESELQLLDFSLTVQINFGIYSLHRMWVLSWPPLFLPSSSSFIGMCALSTECKCSGYARRL